MNDKLGPRPPTVEQAVKLLYASLLIGVAKVLTDFDQVVSHGSVVSALLVMAGTLLIIVFLIMKISQGRNWARIIFLVFFLLGIPLSIPLYLDELRRNIMVAGLSGVQVTLQVVALLLLFKSASTAWFKGRTQAIRAEEKPSK